MHVSSALPFLGLRVPDLLTYRCIPTARCIPFPHVHSGLLLLQARAPPLNELPPKGLSWETWSPETQLEAPELTYGLSAWTAERSHCSASFVVPVASHDAAQAGEVERPQSKRAQQVLAWLQKNLGIAPEHLTDRHDNIFFVLGVYSQPMWFTAPYLLIIWGVFGGWRTLFWVPCVCFTCGIQVICIVSLWYPPEGFINTKAGLSLSIGCVSLFSFVISAPLFLQPICGNECIPLHNLIAYTAAISAYSIVEVRSPPSLSPRDRQL